MSGDALGWAKKQICGGRGPKDVLKTMADYADDNGFAWTSVARLAFDCEASERTVQRDLRHLEEVGLLRGYAVFDARTGRSRTRLYWFPISADHPTPKMMRSIELERGARVTWVTPSEGDMGDTLQGDMGDTPEGDMGVTGRVTTVSPHKEPPIELSEADASSVGARAVDEAFEALVVAYPAAGIDNTDIPAARTAFAAEVEVVGDPWRIVGAAEAFAADPKTKARTFAPAGLHNWLSRQSYRGRLPAVAQAAGLSEPRAGKAVFEGPAEVRACLLVEQKEAFVVSYLDPARYDPGGRVVFPHSGPARDKLAMAWASLKAMGYALGEVQKGVA